MSDELRLMVAYGLVILGAAILTIGVFGLARMPDLYTRLHAVSKAGFLGVLPFVLATAIAGDGQMAYRAILIGVFLLLTTPVASHAVARAAHLAGEPMETPNALDESIPGSGE